VTDVSPVTPDIPDYIPQTFSAGQTVKFTRAFQEYPSADGWTYTIYFVGATAKFQKTATLDPAGNFLITLLPTDTEVAAGAYEYLGRVTSQDSSTKYDPDRGYVHVQFDLATADAGYNLTQAQKELAALDTIILKRMTGDVPDRYMVGARDVSKVPLEKLKKIRGMVASVVARQINPGTLGTSPVEIAFSLEGNSADFPPTWVDVVGLQEP
jgi:hypothetical protein